MLLFCFLHEVLVGLLFLGKLVNKRLISGGPYLFKCGVLSQSLGELSLVSLAVFLSDACVPSCHVLCLFLEVFVMFVKLLLECIHVGGVAFFLVKIPCVPHLLGFDMLFGQLSYFSQPCLSRSLVRLLHRLLHLKMSLLLGSLIRSLSLNVGTQADHSLIVYLLFGLVVFALSVVLGALVPDIGLKLVDSRLELGS